MNQSKFRPSRGCKLIPSDLFWVGGFGEVECLTPSQRAKFAGVDKRVQLPDAAYKLTKPDRPSVKGVAYSAVPGLCGLVEWWELWSFGYLSRARPIATNPRMAGS